MDLSNVCCLSDKSLSRNSDNQILWKHCTLPTLRISHYIPPSGQVVWHHLFLLLIRTQMLPSKAPVTPATDFQWCVSPPLTRNSHPNHSASSQTQNPFAYITHLIVRASKGVGLIIFLFIHKALTGVWRNISVRHKQGLTDLSGSRVYFIAWVWMMF